MSSFHCYTYHTVQSNNLFQLCFSQDFPIKKHTDKYSPSKALAEKEVINYNNAIVKNSGDPLVTVSVRPAAIYGEDERRHFSRIVKHIDSDLFKFRIGRALVDWVYIDNLVHAYILLANELLQQKRSEYKVGGQCYFISDGSPIGMLFISSDSK